MVCPRSYPFLRLPRTSSKPQADINERVNLLRFAKLVPTFSNRARPESRRFAYRVCHDAFAFLASDPPTLGPLGELRDKFPENYSAVFRVAVCRIFCLPSSRILSTQRSPTACASCHPSVQAMRGAFVSAGVDMSIDAWATAMLAIWLDVAEMLRSTPLTLG
jgi:hypothetical protein